MRDFDAHPDFVGDDEVRAVEKKELVNMAESKAIPYNLVAGDKDKKSGNVGIAFFKDGAKVPISITLSLTRVRKLMEEKRLTSRKEEASKTQYPNEYEGDETIRVVAFKKTKKPSV
jgi:hypothetical protein